MSSKAVARLRHAPGAMLVVVVLCLATGCSLFRPKPKDLPPPPPPQNTSSAKPTAEQLVSYLNRQADKLNSIETRDLEIDLRSQGMSVSLEGSLVCQKPRNFRLVGKKPILGEQLLVGSNDERFWFYAKQDQTLYHCSHVDYERGTAQDLPVPVPFQPEWVLEALGMSPIRPGETARVEEDRSTYSLIEDSSFRGQKVRKITVFYKGLARDSQPQIVSRTIQDVTSGKPIFIAKISQVSRIPLDDGGVVACPRVILLEWPPQDTKITLDLGKARINSPMSSEQFQMPRVGTKEIDFGRDRPTGRVVPAGYR